jgi:hypothetical protein
MGLPRGVLCPSADDYQDRLPARIGPLDGWVKTYVPILAIDGLAYSGWL